MFQLGGVDVLGDALAAVGPGIVADGRVGPGPPELRGESGREGVGGRPAHVRVHPGELLDRQEVPVGQRDVVAALEIGRAHV